MSSFPSVDSMVGGNDSVYEAYYLMADPSKSGAIGAMDSARFLKRSALDEKILSKIWDLSDPAGSGYLDKTRFFVALKLISLSQSGQELGVDKLTLPSPDPNLGEIPANVRQTISEAANWDIKGAERSKYEGVFDSLKPENNKLPGAKCKQVMVNSKLPVDVLGKIWDLSDVDKDGFLDREEFCLALHLIHGSLEKKPLPSVLSATLMPPSKRPASTAAQPGLLPSVTSQPPLPASHTNNSLTANEASWVVSPTERAQFEAIFNRCDSDHDGYVSGAEVRDELIKTGVDQQTLAKIWGLCDMSGSGKINVQQFCLMMHLIQKKQQGVNPPDMLSSDMIPPSMREKSDFGGAIVTEYTKELELLEKEIEDMKREQLVVEQSVAQCEADVQLRSSEVTSAQLEFDSVSHTLHILETQKQEAQKRLDEIDELNSGLALTLKEIMEKMEGETQQVEELKQEIQNHENLAKNQTVEVTRLRDELSDMHVQESRVQAALDGARQQLESIKQGKGEVEQQISKLRSENALLEQQKLKLGGISKPSSSIGQIAIADVGRPASAQIFSRDPFSGSDPFGQTTAKSSADPFAGVDPFASSSKGSSGFDPFGGFGEHNNANNTDLFGGAVVNTKKAPPRPDSAPNQKKKAPPRPAPPRPKSGPSTSAARLAKADLPTLGSSTEPFGSTQAGAGSSVDPFDSLDPFSSQQPSASSTDPFGGFADFSPSKFENNAWPTS